MGKNDSALVVGGLALGGGLLYALTRPKSAAASTTSPATPAPLTLEDLSPTTTKPSSPSSTTKPSSKKLPTGTYWNPYTRAKPGEVDAAILAFTKGWVWPVETEPVSPWRKAVVSDGYHYRPTFISKKHPKGRWHNGVDIMYRRATSLAKKKRIKHQQSKRHDMWPGTRAIACGPGRVVRAGRIGTGGRVLIDHGNNIHTAYLHLDRIDVKQGDVTKRGQIIGTVGRDGGLYHMHFEMWFGFLHKVLDPSPYLRQWSTVARWASAKIAS